MTVNVIILAKVFEGRLFDDFDLFLEFGHFDAEVGEKIIDLIKVLFQVRSGGVVHVCVWRRSEYCWLKVEWTCPTLE